MDIISSAYVTLVSFQNFYVFTNAQVRSIGHVLDVRQGRYALQFTSYNATNGVTLLQAPAGGSASSNFTLLYSSLRLDDYYVLVLGNSYLIVEQSYFEMTGSSTLAVTSGTVVIRAGSSFVLDTLEELFIRSNSLFLVSFSSYATFKPQRFVRSLNTIPKKSNTNDKIYFLASQNVTLDDRSVFAVSVGSKFDFNGQVFFLANGSVLSVDSNSRVSFSRGVRPLK